LEIVDKARSATLGSSQAGGLGDVVIYDMPPSVESWVHNGPAGKRRDWEPAVDQTQVVQGPVFASIRTPGKIGGHAITREVRLWNDCPRIEFGVELDTQQADNAIMCIRFPVGIAGNVVAGIPFGVESRDNLEKEPFRGEMFATGFPEGYDATRWTDVSTSELGYTFICPPGMHTGYAFKKADQTIEFILNRFQPMPKDYFGRAALSIEGKGHNRWWCALVPHSQTWREAKSYRQAMEQHVPLMAWTTARGLGRGGESLYKELNKADRPQQDVLPPDAVHPQPSMSLVEVTPDNVALSAMRLVPPAKPGDRPTLELRLYETAGRPADVVIRLARPAVSAELTNLLGEPMPQAGKVQIDGNEVRFHIEPWKIANLRIRDR
jgi:alpha-mannosidase